MSVVQYLNHSNRHRQVFNVPTWRREESIEPSEKSIKRIQKSDPKVWPNGNEVGEKYTISSHLFKSWWLELLLPLWVCIAF
uniref:Putative ovule protein n=1 Tax=Solanum chacoense TaxID=4108 RepID=A0A0V0HCQ0_SOLCH